MICSLEWNNVVSCASHSLTRLMVVCSDSSSSHGGFHSDSSYPTSIFFWLSLTVQKSACIMKTLSTLLLFTYFSVKGYLGIWCCMVRHLSLYSTSCWVSILMFWFFYSQYHNYQMLVKAYRPLKWWISSVAQGRWCCVLTAVKSVCAWIFYATFSTPLTWCVCEHDTVFSGLCEHDF